MPLYESVVIARQDISSTQVDTLADDLTKILEENGGSVAKREHWGLRSLTFRIKKNRKGHYVLFNVDAPPAAVAEYERRMRINEDAFSVQMRDLAGEIYSFRKADLISYEKAPGHSLMPGYNAVLDGRQIDDLVSYLMSLRN